MLSLTTILIILYIGLSIITSVVIVSNNPDDVDVKDLDNSKTPLKPYTLSILGALISILFFIKLSIISGVIFAVSAIIDFKRKL